jgi:hypothetical protein
MPLEDYDPAAASELSQGHNVIYLVLRVLAAPSGATVVIDEPELHLNPALIQSYISLIYQAVYSPCSLQGLMERERSDCFFVFVTHSSQSEYAGPSPPRRVARCKR